MSEQKIPLDQIEPNPDQPRRNFDPAYIRELADSIKAEGLIQPITVRRLDRKRYEIVAGECRYRALCLLRDDGERGFDAIPCFVRAFDNLKRDTAAIIENLQRADITLMEEAHAFNRYIEEHGLTVEAAAKRLGLPVPRIRSRLSLLNLEPSLIRLLEADQLPKPQALELARLPNHADQIRLVQMINCGELGKWKSLKAAVDTILGGVTQADFFGTSASVATPAEVTTLNAMEAKIERAAALLSAGWKDGECIVATKVSPDRAALMADKLAAIRLSVRHMEQELRHVTAQARIAIVA
jgi:ParB/RepB/Spo0J family partition protein